jgi:SAM-dependent methyltransferase
MLAGHPRLRSAWYLLLQLQNMAGDRGSAGEPFERLFAGDVDPWGYESSGSADLRNAVALDLLETWLATREGRAVRALEIGCAEGSFTGMLAPHCGELVAIDISPTAVQRAVDRCADLANVSFEVGDARTTPLPGRFDLIVCMDVAAYFHRPLTQYRTMSRIAAALAPGGALLVSEVIQEPLIENAWWSAPLGRGGRNITHRWSAAVGAVSRREERATDKHRLLLAVKPG